MREERPVVFVIDDDPSMRKGLEDLLHSVDLGAQTFGSAQEFLQSTRPDAPGCIVLDVRLPGPSGLEFQRMLINSNIRPPTCSWQSNGARRLMLNPDKQTDDLVDRAFVAGCEGPNQSPRDGSR